MVSIESWRIKQKEWLVLEEDRTSQSDVIKAFWKPWGHVFTYIMQLPRTCILQKIWGRSAELSNEQAQFVENILLQRIMGFIGW